MAQQRQRGRGAQHGSRRDGRGRESHNLDFNASDVIAAVGSLYDDELKPFGRVILKRLREIAAAKEAAIQGYHAHEIDPEEMPKIDPKRLRRICEACPSLEVHPEEGREYSALFIGRANEFVDVRSEEDLYPEVFWTQVGEYFEQLDAETLRLPGGRYACARVLRSRCLAFMKGFSLGEMCHVVQLAISRHKMLGYLEGHLVPFHASEERIKEQCAINRQPFGQRKGSALALGYRLASWEDARQGLKGLLAGAVGQDAVVVRLSNVKRLFRSRWKMELSETALGHSKLQDLLSDDRLCDICVVKGHGNGQILVRSAPKPAPQKLRAMLPPAPRAPPPEPCRQTQVPISLCSVPYPEVEAASPWASPYFGPCGWVEPAGCEALDWGRYGGFTGHGCDFVGEADGLAGCAQAIVDVHRVASGHEVVGAYAGRGHAAAEAGAGFAGERCRKRTNSLWSDMTDIERPASPWTPPETTSSDGYDAVEYFDELAQSLVQRQSSFMTVLNPFEFEKRCHNVKNTFIHFEEASAAVRSCRRAASVPPCFGDAARRGEAECLALLTPPRGARRPTAASM